MLSKKQAVIKSLEKIDRDEDLLKLATNYSP